MRGRKQERREKEVWSEGGKKRKGGRLLERQARRQCPGKR